MRREETEERMDKELSTEKNELAIEKNEQRKGLKRDTKRQNCIIERTGGGAEVKRN
jgi:hypothetical protein